MKQNEITEIKVKQETQCGRIFRSESGSAINTRKSVFDLLARMEKGAYSPIILDGELNLRGSVYSHRDKTFITALFYGVLERQITLDYIIGKFANSKPDMKVRILLRMALYQIMFMDSVPHSAAVNESVNLAAKHSKGYVNAVLRNFLRNGGDFLNADFTDLRLKYSCPEWLIQKWQEEYGEEAAIQILRSSFLKPPEFKQGGYTQDLSSYEACKLLNPLAGETIIDLCSAPGGKSFTIARLMENLGRVISCDINRKKLKQVEQRAKQLGLDIIEVCENDAKVFNPDFPKADKVVCDVPCSGLGVIRRKPEIKYRPATDFEGLPAIQSQILRTSAGYVKDSGVLMYSTCTLSRRENEDVVAGFLSDNPDFTLIEKRTTIPSEDGGDGFFVALMRKL